MKGGSKRHAIGGPGRLVVVSGPSGVGKTAVCSVLVAAGLAERAVTATTRPPRPGEREGEDYRFHNRASFRRALEAGELLEWAEVHGHLYGTPLEPLREQLRAGGVVLLLIDVQGAAQLMERGVAADYVFLEPPCFEELERRLRSRGSEDSAALALRLDNARRELGCKEQFDHCVVNDEIEAAAERLKALLGLGGPRGGEAPPGKMKREADPSARHRDRGPTGPKGGR